MARGIIPWGATYPDSLATGQVLISLGSCVGAGKVKKSVKNENMNDEGVNVACHRVSS